MVLAYRGLEYSEGELAWAFGTVSGLGTNPEGVIVGLEGMGYHALWFENATLERLVDLLAMTGLLSSFCEQQICPMVVPVCMQWSWLKSPTLESSVWIQARTNHCHWGCRYS